MADLIMGKSNKTLLASLLKSVINLNNNNNLNYFFFTNNDLCLNFSELLATKLKYYLLYR